MYYLGRYLHQEFSGEFKISSSFMTFTLYLLSISLLTGKTNKRLIKIQKNIEIKKKRKRIQPLLRSPYKNVGWGKSLKNTDRELESSLGFLTFLYDCNFPSSFVESLYPHASSQEIKYVHLW